MLQSVIGIFIFCIVLFLYLHIQYHFKTSNDLEIYDAEQLTKENLEEICDLRQPLLFNNLNQFDKIIQYINKDVLVKTYPMFDIKIRETKTKINNTEDINEELYLPLSMQVANNLFNEDKEGKYFTESNHDFLKETGAIKHITYNDEFLRPPLVSNCNYDILMGSTGSSTPLKYEISYRTYFMATQGSVKIKLCPPIYEKYIYAENDYENFEFKSPINPWKVENIYKSDYDKIKWLEIDLTPGRTFYMPAYWYYSILFDKNSSVCCIKYRTYMNNIAIMPKLIMYALQNQNVVRKVNKVKTDMSVNSIQMDDLQNKIKEDNTTPIENLVPAESIHPNAPQ